jgi:hypothetical protein
VKTYTGGYTYPTIDYMGVDFYARCHSAENSFLNPRWAAQTPLLKKKGNQQQFYCVDSTGAGYITTTDLGQASQTEYMGCVPEPES